MSLKWRFAIVIGMIGVATQANASLYGVDFGGGSNIPSGLSTDEAAVSTSIDIVSEASTGIGYSLTGGESYTGSNTILSNAPWGAPESGDESAPTQFSSDLAHLAVPESATVFSGALLLAPLAVSCLRILRKRQLA